MTYESVWGGDQLLAAFATATTLLESRRAEIDALNVFPVPDGDTGTNMSLTMNAALNEARRSAGANPTAGLLAERIAHGALLGARGNSGVILSQIYRGFAKAIAECERIDGHDLAAGLRLASETAYHAVMKPVEGTMLTVIRVAAEHATRAVAKDPSLTPVLEAALTGAREALANTPNLLPTLRQAGLVDSGGKGLVVILDGFLAAATGRHPDLSREALGPVAPDLTAIEMALDHDGYGYCTNFMISGAGIPFDTVRADLAAMGTSAVIVGDDRVVKVHIHTEHPGSTLEYALEWGSLSQIKIDNMDRLARDFAATLSIDQDPERSAETEISVIAVASGHGIASAFRDLGASDVISGGKTMNPSIEEMLEAVSKASGESVILLPNDSNVLMAAEQVRTLSKKSIEVVPTRTIPQGLSALSAFRPDLDLASNAVAMTRGARGATSVEIARAEKNVLVDSIVVRRGQFIALVNDRLVNAGDDLINLTTTSLERPIAEGAELATIFVGADLDKLTSAALQEQLCEQFGDVEFEFLEGGQPHYQLVIALE